VTTAAICALIAAIASALAKISLDATIQNELPEASRASAFGRSETILQLAWVLGGALGVLLPTNFEIGFFVVSALMAVGVAQTAVARGGRSLVPPLHGLRPTMPGLRRRRPADPGEAPTAMNTKVMPTDRAEHR
jgi:hypothetical protein